MSVNKKIITALILTFALLLSLSACGNSSNENAKGDESTTTAPSSTVSESTAEETSSEAQQTETSEPIVTTVPTTIATEPEETTEPTETEPPQPTSSASYVTNIAGSVGIYQRPDWNSGFVQYVGASGLYTIVEEAYDSQGNLWGKLKSGAGWVILEESSYSPRVCSKCGKSEPDAFFGDGSNGGICWECSYYGDIERVYCPQCGADCTYRGVEEDGRCEDCYYGKP